MQTAWVRDVIQDDLNGQIILPLTDYKNNSSLKVLSSCNIFRFQFSKCCFWGEKPYAWLIAKLEAVHKLSKPNFSISRSAKAERFDGRARSSCARRRIIRVGQSLNLAEGES